MSRTLLKIAVLLSFSLLANACGEDDKNGASCDNTYVISCDGNAKLACVSGKIVKTDCLEQVCDAGICVKAQTKECDATYKPSCLGNETLTCVGDKIVKTNCGANICTTGVCVDIQTQDCDATYKPSCLGNETLTCVGDKIVKTNCGSNLCKAGVCVDIQTQDCDATYTASCLGNEALTCVAKKVVKTDCGTKTCTAGVCVGGQIDACDATYTASCAGNVAQTCVEKKLVKTDCGTKTCTAGVCVEPQVEACDSTYTPICVLNVAQTCFARKLVKKDCGTKSCVAGACVTPPEVCDDKYKPSCAGNEALTCVGNKVVKTDCGLKTCVTGECKLVAPELGKPCTRDACLGNDLFECVGKVYVAPTTCAAGTVCSTDKQGLTMCLDSCTEADKGKKRSVCDEDDDDGPFVLNHICDLDALGQYVYDEDFNAAYTQCPASCSDGKCVKLTDDDGNPCDFDTFIERCEKGFIVYCGDRYDYDLEKYVGIVTTVICAPNHVPALTCQVKKSENYAACVAPCKAGDAAVGTCELEMTTSTLYKNSCIEATNASFYYFPDGFSADCKTCDAKTLTCTK